MKDERRDPAAPPSFLPGEPVAGPTTAAPPAAAASTRAPSGNGVGQTPPPGARPVASPLRVLIADDAAVVRERLVAMVSEIPGVAVVAEAGCVQETLRAVREHKPQVVILDLSMPDGSGLDVLAQMRREQLEAVVLVLTNYPYQEYELLARERGASAFLDKSREFMKVTELVRDLAARARASA